MHNLRTSSSISKRNAAYILSVSVFNSRRPFDLYGRIDSFRRNVNRDNQTAVRLKRALRVCVRKRRARHRCDSSARKIRLTRNGIVFNLENKIIPRANKAECGIDRAFVNRSANLYDIPRLLRERVVNSTVRPNACIVHTRRARSKQTFDLCLCDLFAREITFCFSDRYIISVCRRDLACAVPRRPAGQIVPK